MTVTDKQSLRTDMLAKRQAIDAGSAQDAALALAKNLLTIFANKSKIVAGYVPMRGEIDVIPALDALSLRGHVLCLPAIADEQMIFRAWQPGIDLVTGAHGTREPMADAPVVIPDIVIVPLVAFDARGHRLGYGAGYYDRTLEQLRKRNKNLLAIGAAYAVQQVKTIPAEIHDQMLDKIVTEKSIINS